MRAPFFIRWPGHIPAGARIPQVAGAIGILPTLLDFTNIPRVGDKPLDGISLKPLLSGSVKDWPARTIFSHWAGKVSARTQRYRLDNLGKLYDMQTDPAKSTDVSKEHPEIAAELLRAVEQFRKEQLPLMNSWRCARSRCHESTSWTCEWFC